MSSTRKGKGSAASSRRGPRGAKSGSIISRYTPEEIERRGRGRTDWARIDALTGDEIEAVTRSDPAFAEFVDIDWSKAEVVVPPRKRAISIRLDEDLIEFFRRQGSGYQTRINAILRKYMAHIRGE